MKSLMIITALIILMLSLGYIPVSATEQGMSGEVIVRGNSEVTYQDENDSDPLYEYYNTGDVGVMTISGTGWKAQTFTVNMTGHTIASIKVKLYRAGSPIGTSYISIRTTDENGHPTGEDLTVASFDGDTITDNSYGEWYDFPVTEYTLPWNVNSRYAIVLRAPSANGTNLCWFFDDTSPTYKEGNFETSSNSGSSWTAYESIDCMFEIWGNTGVVPSYGMLDNCSAIEDVYAIGSGADSFISSQIKFDISSIPENVGILSVNLYLYRYTSDYGIWIHTPRIVRVDNQTWDETIDNSGFDSQIITNTENWRVSGSDGSWTVINVKNLFLFDYDVNNDNFTFRLSDNLDRSSASIVNNENLKYGSFTAYLMFYSKDATSYHPYLEVEYLLPNPPDNLKVEDETSPQRLTTLTPEFTFRYTDNNNNDMQAFQIQVGTSAGDNSKWDNTTTQENENNDTISITYAGTALSRGTTYWWRTKVQDNYDVWSYWSANENFQINQIPAAPTLFTNLSLNEIDHTPQIEWVKGTDPDGDTIWTYVYMDGNYPPTTLENYPTDNIETIGENSITLVDGENYYYRLRNWDGYEWSENYSGIDNFRMNTPPTVIPTIAPLEPLDDENLVVSVATSDNEGDTVTCFFQWYENTTDAMTGENENILDNTLTVAFRHYRCLVTPNDSYENGTAVYTTEITITPTSNLLIVSSTIIGNQDNATITVVVRYSDNVVLDNVSALLKVSNSWESRVENNNDNQLIWNNVNIPDNTNNIKFYLDNVMDDRAGTSYIYIEDNNFLEENTTATFTLDVEVLSIFLDDSATFSGTIISNAGYIDLNVEAKLMFGSDTIDNENYVINVGENQAWTLTDKPTSSTSYIVRMYENTTQIWYHATTIYVSIVGSGNGGGPGGPYEPPDVTYSILFYVYNPVDNLPLNEVWVEASLGAFVLDSGDTDENGKVWLEVGEGYWDFNFIKDKFEHYTLENIYISTPKDYTITLQPMPPGITPAIITTGIVAAMVVVVVVIMFSWLFLTKRVSKKLQKMM